MNNITLELLNERGITLKNLSSLVSTLKDTKENDENYQESILNILSIKEIKDFVCLGIILDIYTENGLLPDQLQDILSGEDPFFNLDKALAINIINTLGSDGIINFSYLQKEKIDEIKKLISKNKVNTFLDDIICLIVASATLKLY